MPITNNTIAQAVNDLVAYWDSFNEEYATWLGGAVGGGPNSDGEYPLTDYSGNVTLTKCPAQLESDVDSLVTGAAGHKTDAEAAQAAAEAAQTAAELAETNAETADTGAVSARDAALAAQSAAESARSTAIAQAGVATTQATDASASATAASTSETNAAASETKASEWAEQAEDVEVETGQYSALHHAAKAAASAAAAQTFDPSNYAALADAETITGPWTFDALATFGTGGTLADATAILSLNIEREWQFRSYGSGSGTRLGLFSTSNKKFDVGSDNNGVLAQFDTNNQQLIMTGDIFKESGGAYVHYWNSTWVGGKITVSSGEPSTPAKGDIWFDIS